MIQFEDKLQASAQRLADKENRHLHVPKNPIQQKRIYWGWVATPAAAVAGIVLGLSLHLFMGGAPDAPIALATDTIRIFQPVLDTLYLTQVVERKKVVEKYIPGPQTAQSETTGPDAQPELPTEPDTTEECTSIRCDGINYALLVSE